MNEAYWIEKNNVGNYAVFLLKKRRIEQRIKHSPAPNSSHGNAVGMYSARNPRKAVSVSIDKEPARTPFSMLSFVKSQMNVRKIVNAPVIQRINSDGLNFATLLDARR